MARKLPLKNRKYDGRKAVYVRANIHHTLQGGCICHFKSFDFLDLGRLQGIL
jgi:hypothetical protein